MNFDRTYELLGLLEGDSERKTYIGRENSTGREVFVHLLAGGAEQTLLSMAERYLTANPEARSNLQIGTFQNQCCLITASGPEFRSIRRLLEPRSTGDQFEKVRMWKVPTVDESPAKPAESSDVGEFTRMFSNTASPEPQPPPPSVGEFTRIFTASKSPEPSSTGSTVPIDKTPVAPDKPGSSGAFTQMFSTAPSRSDPPPPSAAIDKGPVVQDKPESAGSFTQMFSPAPSRSGSGEFTRMFRPGAAAAPAPAPIKSEKWSDSSQPVLNMNLSGSDGATGAFQVPSTPPPPAAITEQGPSEFTRMMSVPAALPKEESSNASSPPAPPAPAEPASQKKSYLPMIIILNVLFVAAVILVLVFLLKR
jgi:hypothetical protein